LELNINYTHRVCNLHLYSYHHPLWRIS